MAFTAGIKRPQINSGNSGTQQSSFDRLVTVIGYDTAKKVVFVEDEKGRKYEVSINKDEYLRAEESVHNKKLDVSSIKWMGHDINAKMEKANPVGSKLILQRTKVLKKDNGEGFALTETSRIIGVTNPEPDKTFQGVFTLSYRIDEEKNKRIARVRHFQPLSGIDINDDETIEQLKKEIDEAVSHFDTKIGENPVTVPTLGIQMRALMKTDKLNPADGTPIYQAVDSTINFDWMREENPTGKLKGHPLTGDEMMALREGYIDYIMNHEQFKEHLNEMKLEIIPYRVYPASKNKNLQLTFGIDKRDANADKNPLYQLSHRQNFVDIDQNEKVEGVNYAVNGIIQISGNKLEKVNGKAVEIPNYWVNNIHANHIKGHVFAFIRTSEGYKVEVHPNLQLLKDMDNNNTNTNQNNTRSAPATSQSASAPAPSSTPTRQASASTTKPTAPVEDDGEDFNPFEYSADEPARAPTPETKPSGVRFGKR